MSRSLIVQAMLCALLTGCGGGSDRENGPFIEVGAVAPPATTHYDQNPDSPFFLPPTKGFSVAMRQELEAAGIYVVKARCMGALPQLPPGVFEIDGGLDAWALFTIRERDWPLIASLGFSRVDPDSDWREVPCALL